jgi:hypothetical protein
MLWKNLTLGIVVVLFSSLGAVQASGTDGQCTQLLNTVCNDCHNTDRVCDSMGGPEKKWKAILDWMISNGAELEKEEITLLVNCLTEPFEEAKKACGK